MRNSALAVVIAAAGLLAASAVLADQTTTGTAPAPGTSATTGTTATSTTTTAAATTETPKPTARQIIICRWEDAPVGTFFGARKVCKSKADWDLEEQRAQESLRNVQENGGNATNGIH